jgi:uncharacterized protein (DUF2141 family)
METIPTPRCSRAAEPLCRRGRSLALSLALLTTLDALASPPSLSGSPLDVEVEGFSSDRGRAVIRVFPRGGAFPDDSAATLDQLAPIRDHRVRVRFADVADGAYAVAAVHDENCDQRLTRAAYGVPLEGFGFSDKNSGAGAARLPTFDEAALSIDATQRVIRLRVVYPVPRSAAISTSCPPASSPSAGPPGSLRIRIKGVDPGRRGAVRIRLYAAGEAFPGEKSIPSYALSLPASAATLQAEFVDLPPGRYAAILWQDVNVNSQHDRGEPLTYTGPAKRYGRLPRFQDASLEIVPGAAADTEVQLRSR